MAQARGSIWKNSNKKKHYPKSIGSYEYRKASDRLFVLTAVKSGKTRVYESPAAAMAAGWYIVQHGK